MMAVQSLQDLCCNFICENSKKYTKKALVNELNYPCLEKIVNNLSMYDVLVAEQFLEEKGFCIRSLLNNIQCKGYGCRERYPISSVVCPHLLNMCRADGLKWSLSELFWQDIIIKAVEANMAQSEESQVSLAWLQNDIDVVRFFLSSNQLQREPETLDEIKFSHEDLLELCTLAAKKIMYLRVDEYLCDFLKKDEFKTVFHSLCLSLLDISVIVSRNVPCVLNFLKLLVKDAKNLSRICLWALTATNMEFFDELLSLCSGVITFKDIQRESTVKSACELKNVTPSPLHNEDEMDIVTHLEELPPTDELSINNNRLEERKSEEEDFDLMDDAVLFGSVNTRTRFDNYKGMPRADIKISNLLPEKYAYLLEHHFTYWMALTELHLKVPELNPKIVSSLCLLLSRPSFKSLLLSNAEFTHSALNELLSCVASKRKSCPLDKLMLVNLQEKISNIQDLKTFTFNHLEGMSEEAIIKFVKQYESEQIAKEKSFQGTKLFEMFGCSMNVQTECLTLQYILADTAITQLSLFDSLSRLFVRATIKFLSHLNRKFMQLILQDWSMRSQEDCDALVCLLHSISISLESLSLEGCFRSRPQFSFQTLVQAIFTCTNLKSLNLSDNNIGNVVMQFIHPVTHARYPRELCLRQISCNKPVLEEIITFLASACKNSRPHLDIVDLRDNVPVQGNKINDQVFNKDIEQRVAKRVLYDRWFAMGNS